MKVKNMKDVPGVPVGQAAPGVTKQLLVGEGDGAATFAMRCFTIAPGGATPWHQHDWEHEVLVVEGEGVAVSREGDTPIKRGNVIFVPGGEMHQFRNPGKSDFAMVCLVPMRGEK